MTDEQSPTPSPGYPAHQPVGSLPSSPEAAPAAVASPGLGPPNPRRAMAIWGGGLTGIGIGIALACVLYAFERANGWGPVINSSVFIVLIVAGPAIGFGLGMAVAALIPNAERPPGPVTPSPDPVQIPAGGYTAGHPRST